MLGERPAVLVVVDRAEPKEQRRAERAGRASGKDGFDQFAAAGYFSCPEVIVGGVYRSFARRLRSARRCQPRGLLFYCRCFLWRSPRRRVPGRAVENLGDLFTRSRCAEGQMPGSLLDALGSCPQPLVHLPALIQRHLGVQDRPQERMREPQRVTVTFDDARVDGLVDRDPGLPVVTGRADQPLAQVGGGSNQPAHPPSSFRQPERAASHKVSQALRDGDGLVGEGHSRVLEERTCALERVEGVPATCFMQPRQGVPGQHVPQS